MALLLKNNIIYLHIPKTGGTTLRELFKKNNLIKYEIGYKHATLDRVGNINRGNLNNLFFEVYKCTIVYSIASKSDRRCKRSLNMLRCYYTSHSKFTKQLMSLNI